MEEEKITVAFFGTGNIAQRYAEELTRVNNVSVTCLVNKSRGPAESFRSRNNNLCDENTQIFDNYQDAINWGKFDAVYICTRHDSHIDIGIDCIRSGKAVFMEKPLALSLESCQALCRVNEENNGRFMMGGLGFRYYNRNIFKLRHYLPRPKLVIGQFINPRWPDDFWAMDPVMGGGVFFSVGSHLMDMACLVSAGDPVRIISSGGARQHEGNLIDTIACLVEFDNGTLASLAFGDCGEVQGMGEMTLEAYDGARSARIEQFLPTDIEPRFYERKGYFEEGTAWQGEFDGLQNLPESPTEDFINYLRTGKCSDIFPTLKDGVRSIALLEKAKMSAELNVPMSITPIPPLEGYYR